MRRSRIESAKEKVAQYFKSINKNGFTAKELSSILDANRSAWKLSKAMSGNKFIEALQNLKILQAVELTCPQYGHSSIRYLSEAPFSIYQLAQSLKNRSYFTHRTALYLQGLIDRQPDTIYINVEQTPKPPNDSTLIQGNIDRAFEASARTSKYVFEFQNWKIVIINGKNTNNLGTEIASRSEGNLLVTNLERTLIDIVVRPVYSGGCQEVLNAYKKAKDKISVDEVIKMLQKLDYAYPYHQAIGFYMQQAGFDDLYLKKIRELGINYIFYLDYRMKNKVYSDEWKIYYPDNLRA